MAASVAAGVVLVLLGGYRPAPRPSCRPATEAVRTRPGRIVPGRPAPARHPRPRREYRRPGRLLPGAVRRTDVHRRADHVAHPPDWGVNTTLESLVLDPARQLEPPRDYSQAGWWIQEWRPLTPEPPSIAGHVDSAVSGPAVFFNPHTLAAGDRVKVDRADRRSSSRSPMSSSTPRTRPRPAGSTSRLSTPNYA